MCLYTGSDHHRISWHLTFLLLHSSLRNFSGLQRLNMRSALIPTFSDNGIVDWYHRGISADSSTSVESQHPRSLLVFMRAAPQSMITPLSPPYTQQHEDAAHHELLRECECLPPANSLCERDAMINNRPDNYGDAERQMAACLSAILLLSPAYRWRGFYLSD